MHKKVQLVANVSRNLLQILEKNNLNLPSIQEVQITGGRRLGGLILTKEIAKNTLLTAGNFINVFLKEGVYYSHPPSDI